MNIQPGFKKIANDLEEANLLSLLHDHIAKKGLGDNFTTADFAKDCCVSIDALNRMIEQMSDKGVLLLVDAEGGSMMDGQSENTGIWKVSGILIELSAVQQTLLGAEENVEEPVEPGYDADKDPSIEPGQ